MVQKQTTWYENVPANNRKEKVSVCENAQSGECWNPQHKGENNHIMMIIFRTQGSLLL
jgi:hypothetical protein